MAFTDALNVPCATASIDAATVIASVPPPSWGALNSTLPSTSLAFISVRDVARSNLPVLVVASADAPITLSWSADSSHSMYAPAEAPKSLTSCPVSSTPTVRVPFSVNAASATVIKSVSSVCPIVVPLISTLSISNEPPDISPVVVMVLEPVSMLPNPDVIEPAFSAPVEVKPVIVVMLF